MRPTGDLPLLRTGGLLLLLSLVLTFLLPAPFDQDHARGVLTMAWVERAAFWVGIVCIAGHVLGLVLRAADARTATDAGPQTPPPIP